MASAGDEDVSIGELNRNVEKLTDTVKDGFKEIRETTVPREVYVQDRAFLIQRIENLEEDAKATAKNRRQMVMFVLGSFATSATALVAALIEARAHP